MHSKSDKRQKKNSTVIGKNTAGKGDKPSWKKLTGGASKIGASSKEHY